MADARQRLLDKLVDHVAATGLSDASLRDLAEAVGSSHRMLLYHFGSREGLVTAIVGTIEERQRVALRDIAAGAGSPRQIVSEQWAQLSDPAMAPFVRLFFEVAAHAMFGRPGTEGFLDDLVTPWLDVADEIAGGLDVAFTGDDLRLGVAVVRGLLLDAVASGDPTGATASLERFLQLWERDAAG